MKWTWSTFLHNTIFNLGDDGNWKQAFSLIIDHSKKHSFDWKFGVRHELKPRPNIGNSIRAKKLENKSKIFKYNLKYLKFENKFGFRGPSMEKIPHTKAKLSVTRFFLWNVVSVSVTVGAETINQFGFQYLTKTKIVVWVVRYLT